MNIIGKMSLGAIVIAAAACSTSDRKEKVPTIKEVLKEVTGQNGRACVRTSDIQGYGTLKYDIVSIDARRKYYLATLLPGCNSVSTSFQALFVGSFSEVCGGAINKMVTREDNCVIHQMYEFESREEAFAVYESAVAKRDEIRDSIKNAK